MELTSFKLGVALFSAVCFKLEQERRKAGKTTRNNNLRIKKCVAVCKKDLIFGLKTHFKNYELFV
jgi:hypothetical protein